jgi:hypothetical protein
VASPNSPGTYETLSMISRRLCPCLALAALLGGPGVFSAPPAVASEGFCVSPWYVSPEERLKPLMDLIAKGEGDYNAVNRGRAGDTPGGIDGLTGKTFDQFTVQQVVEMQASWLYAVGRYQFIPDTLRFAVSMSEVGMKDKFDNETQDKLMAALILYKRPAIGAYLRGDHDYIGWALDELAKEWASIEYRQGRGFYDHIGGNRAHVTRQEAWEVLQEIKRTWQ